jgi:hypothetical protein
MAKVLVAVDHSAAAHEAALSAVRLFGSRADVVVLTVIDQLAPVVLDPTGLVGADPVTIERLGVASATAANEAAAGAGSLFSRCRDRRDLGRSRHRDLRPRRGATGAGRPRPRGMSASTLSRGDAERRM